MELGAQSINIGSWIVSCTWNETVSLAASLDKGAKLGTWMAIASARL